MLTPISSRLGLIFNVTKGRDGTKLLEKVLDVYKNHRKFFFVAFCTNDPFKSNQANSGESALIVIEDTDAL